MSSAQRAYLPDDWRRSELEPEPAPQRAPARAPARPAPSTGVALDRRAVPMTQRELLPMAAILMLVAGVAAMTVLYLAAFATGARQTRTEEKLNAQISAAETTNDSLEAEVARLQRRERVEREAERLGLQPVAPDASDRLEQPGEMVTHAPVAPRGETAGYRAAPARPDGSDI